MAKATTTPKPVTDIVVRMYRAGTGDFFVLKFFSGTRHSFTMMIDCGCIQAGAKTFAPLLQDLKTYTKRGRQSIVDLLVVTHEHEDHLNGFKLAPEAFKNIRFRKVWLAWTEDPQDPLANELRRTQGRMRMALNRASMQLQEVVNDPEYTTSFSTLHNGNRMYEGQQYFSNALSELTALNSNGMDMATDSIPTLRNLLEQWNVIKNDTEVEYLNPGDLIDNLEGALGLKFYILGPPRNRDYILMEDNEEEVFEKRVRPSTVDFSFINLFMGEGTSSSLTEPFADKYQMGAEDKDVRKAYTANPWQQIDHDWLFSAGNLALKLYKNINNTSLAFAIQFAASGKVLLFPGDSEMGCWLGWHDLVHWTSRQTGLTETITPEHLLNRTVFYKVSHHLSQNGTLTKKGIDMMNSGELAAMATLDFDKILSGWRNTMPNDLLGATLIEKTKGKLFFVGDRASILRNIQTDRVAVRKTYVDKLNTYNKPFDGKHYIDFKVKG